MVHVLGHWELNYHAPVTEQFYYSFMLRDFGVKNWHMIPLSGIRNNEENHVLLLEWASYDEFFKAFPDLPRVFLEPRTERFNPETTWLHEFEHPEDCVYITGSAHYTPSIAHKREEDTVVSVKTAIDNGVLWGEQALAITLYDRMVKSWQSQ